jgi:hypothetical protein
VIVFEIALDSYVLCAGTGYHINAIFDERCHILNMHKTMPLATSQML